jgi:hypothetical protein
MVALKALGIAAAYAVTVAAVVVGVLLSSPDETPWLALLIAVAIVHFGFGLIVARWWAALLPIVVSIVAVIADLGGFSVTTLLVGVPCTMLVIAGTSLRIGWDGGGRSRSSGRRRRARGGDDAAEWQDPEWHDEPRPDGVWGDAEHAT